MANSEGWNSNTPTPHRLSAVALCKEGKSARDMVTVSQIA
jgi:hypothetical protein